MSTFAFPEHDTDTLVLEKETVTVDSSDLVIFNDEVNTFEHVIDTLIKVCSHSEQQAEQCTLLIHHKGKCAVKNGSFEELKPMHAAICDKGISAEIM